MVKSRRNRDSSRRNRDFTHRFMCIPLFRPSFFHEIIETTQNYGWSVAMIQQQLLFRRLHAVSKSSYTLDTQLILYRPQNSFATSARSPRHIQRLECFASSHNRRFKQRRVMRSSYPDKAILRKGRIGQEARGGSEVLPALQRMTCQA